MREKGLEPPRREAPDPKSGAATNYATPAVRIFEAAKIGFYLFISPIILKMIIEDDFTDGFKITPILVPLSIV